MAGSLWKEWWEIEGSSRDTHESGTGLKGEIGVVFSDIITAADNVQKYKYVVKMVAHLNGKTVHFMAKANL